MFRRDLLTIIRPRPFDTAGLIYAGGFQKDGVIISGDARTPQTGESYPIKNGYLDLLKDRTGADNLANLANFLPGVGRAYEPLWRVHSLNLLAGESFPNEREVEVISRLVGLKHGGRYLDLGCSSGLYARSLSLALGGRGDIVGIDISPSMLREAARRARKACAPVSLARADAEDLPFSDGSFSGVVCGGTLNELGDTARALRESHRVLEPGGRFAVMGILKAQTSPPALRLQRFLSSSGLRFFETGEMRSLLDHAGYDLEVLNVHGAVFFAAAIRR